MPKMNLKLKQVPKTYVPKKACVYVISHPENIDNLSKLVSLAYDNPEMYIGVTGGAIAQRWRDHKALRARDNQTTSRFIEDNRYDFDDCFRIIFEGTEDQCYRLEYHLRNQANMGLNQKPGGKLKHRKFNIRYLDMIEEAL
jgi:hypothetical protein